jgi:phosphohistidine swiveling domain-containing protein
MNELIKKFLEDHKGEEIIKHEGNFSSLVWGSACILIYSPLVPKYFKGDFKTLALLLGKKKGIGFFNFEKYKESTRQALEKYLANPKKFTELEDRKKIAKLALKTYNENTLGNIKNKSDEALEKMVVMLFELLRDWQLITLFSEALDEEISKTYFDKLGLKINFKEFIGKSSLVDFESFIFKRNESLLDYNENEPYDSQWIFTNYLETPKIENVPKLEKEMMQDLGGKEELEKEQAELRIIINENRKQVEDYKKTLDSSAKDLFEFIKSAICLRDIRKEEIYRLLTVLSNVLREIFSRNKLDPEKIIYTLYKDYKSREYKKENFNELLSKREKGFLVYFGKNGEEIDYIEFEKAKKSIYKEMFNNDEKIELKGNIANKGEATGKAKVVLSLTDFDKFNEGDILITSMTRPEFVPLMKRASAIVTDEGGITCHAAIISREMDKPCVIGTKNATAFFKDNDLIKVDANNGIVKKLE